MAGVPASNGRSGGFTDAIVPVALAALIFMLLATGWTTQGRLSDRPASPSPTLAPVGP